jgi:hypothetical protein
MQFHLEVYSGDDWLGGVRVNGRYAQMVINGEVYPFRSIEDACVALMALHVQKQAYGKAAAKQEGPASGASQEGEAT